MFTRVKVNKPELVVQPTCQQERQFMNSTPYSRGVINPEELYTLSEFKRRLGVSDATLRAARRNGLRVHYVHKQAYVYGRDWISYVVDVAASRSAAASGSEATHANAAS